MRDETVLVTGASGFIARHVVQSFLAAGYRVRGSVRNLAKGEVIRSALAAAPGVQDRLEFVEADLLDDAGWDDAMAGVAGVVHTASPFPGTAPRDETTLIRPAVGGTRRVLGAAERAGVDRIVLTSSVAAIHGGQPKRTHFGASDWTDVSDASVSAYYKSKTQAERAAWAHVERSGQALTTINPALVLGPPLGRETGTSLDIVAMLLDGRFPMLPRIAIGTIDVRDVARLHLLAYENPGTVGQRLVASNRVMWFSEIATILKELHPERRIPTRELPDWLARLVGRLSAEARQGLVDVGKMWTLDAEPARTLLGDTISTREALGASAQALIALGAVK